MAFDRRWRRSVASFTAFTLAGGCMVPAWAAPAGGRVVAGDASIAQSGTATTIRQSTDRVAIDWQSFGIAANESVRFLQPSSSSIALNRILGQDPSVILGSLSANGQVFLLNPNGVLFGRGAQVDVGGLVASTLNLTNENFMAGRYAFDRAGATGGVVNQGGIRAGSFDERIEDLAGEVGGVPAGEASSLSGAGRARRGDDIGLAHGWLRE